MFTNRRPYYGLKMSTTDFFREPVRYLKESNTQESMMEKPYLEDEYPKMHLKLPDFKFKPREIPSIFGPTAGGDPYPGLAIIDFGDAKCGWNITNIGYCTKGAVIITMTASYFWSEEFKFVAGIAADSIGVSLTQLGETAAGAWDKQDYMVTFPDDANGSVTICGSASTHTLISQTFETVVAGMPVGIHLIGGALLPIEKGQGEPAISLKSVYGEKGGSCGCITLESNCTPPCECKNIGYTTRQMDVSEVQELTVVDSVEECTYNWFITSGGGGLSSQTGTSVNYTAPDTNSGCSNNPTISLMVGGYVCDTLNISANQYDVQTDAYRIDNACTVSCHKNCGSSGLCGVINCTGHPDKYCAGCTLERYGCDDVLRSSSIIYANNNIVGEEACNELMANNCGESSTVDLRTQNEKDAGCCPAGLL